MNVTDRREPADKSNKNINFNIVFTLSRGMDEGQARQRLKNVPIM